LELVHARVREEQRRVVVREHGGRRNSLVAALGEEVEELAAHGRGGEQLGTFRLGAHRRSVQESKGVVIGARLRVTSRASAFASEEGSPRGVGLQRENGSGARGSSAGLERANAVRHGSRSWATRRVAPRTPRASP